MDFMPLQGVKLRFAVAGCPVANCGPDSPQLETIRPAIAGRKKT